ncbi:hypothetical protein [Streptomyces sp. UH6]|uniref:hypothetical protein n=1 Tax=Streptomyces sp. UH6 TaxID=2748379 RepID=UPI0015D4D6D0|nr:hypothetical protein [Streptomyces sp. UH6]NYV74965.1 hypothetical protein [Streptomyces sp. UH6]
MSVLAALLDRSLDHMAEAAADVRLFDREAIRAASDVWDNNLFPLFWAASASGAGERERRATAVLEWMAGLGERRRGWMVEQARIAGYDIEALLSPAKPHSPGRDHLGRVMAPQCRLTRQAVDELLPDYDLATASVRHLQVERAGTRLSAFLRLVVDRKFAVDEPAPPALLDVWLDGVSDVAFRLPDTRGAILDAGVREIGISLGSSGRLRATGGEYRLDDRSWHLSGAGRRADAVTPPRSSRPESRRRPPGGDLSPDTHAAAALLRHSMLELRSVRYAAEADHVPVLKLCRAFSGAGEAILAAGSQHGGRRRDTAFRAVIRTWADQGGPELARWFADILKTQAGRPDLIEEPSAAARTPAPLAGTTPASSEPGQAVLSMVSWTAAHTDYRVERAATAQLQLALPPRPGGSSSAPWRLRTVSCTEPDAFHLDVTAFQGPGSLVQVGKPTAACSLDLHRGALHIAAGDGWSASV